MYPSRVRTHPVSLFAAFALGLSLAGPGLATGLQAAIPKGDVIVELQPVASGLAGPLSVTHAGDGSGRLFIVEQQGQIRVVDGGALLPAPFLDIASQLPALSAFVDERGLLGLAFHPDYATNGRFFVRYSRPRAGSPGEPCFGTGQGCHEEVLAEYAVSPGDPNRADSLSEAILFTVDQPQVNHNAGDLAFGPDGYLYFSLGDGGGSYDGLLDVPPSHGPLGNGQNIETPLGAILRIDVDGADAPLPYAIPDDNPFADTTGVDEIFAYGFRNPYRFSFDDGPGGDGRLLVGDVGQNLREEIDVVVNGGNYGWVREEGFLCLDPADPANPPPSCPGVGPSGEPLLDPLVDYDHERDEGLSVIGGYVFRGDPLSDLFGKYVFGDFSKEFLSPEGRLFYLEETTPAVFEIRELRITAADVLYSRFLKGFGEDEAGDIYVCGSSTLSPFGTGGVVEKLAVITPTGVGEDNARLRPATVNPNPFRSRTRISFAAPAPGRVTVRIHDLQGRRMATLLDAHHDPGEVTLSWDGTDGRGRRAPAGVYFYRAERPGSEVVIAGRLVLLP